MKRKYTFVKHIYWFAYFCQVNSNFFFSFWQDLRNEVEKLRNEVNEREKAVENHYKSLLSESNKKLHSQEQVISRLTESTNQKDKDLLPQVSELFSFVFRFRLGIGFFKLLHEHLYKNTLGKNDFSLHCYISEHIRAFLLSFGPQAPGR